MCTIHLDHPTIKKKETTEQKVYLDFMDARKVYECVFRAAAGTRRRLSWSWSPTSRRPSMFTKNILKFMNEISDLFRN